MRLPRSPLPGCVLACVLALGAAGCDGSSRTATSGPPSSAGTQAASQSPSQSPSPRVTARTTHDNVVATRRFSAWLLHAVPMPPGAREWHRSPTAHYRHGSLGIGPSDPHLGRTTWWTVPLSSAAFDAWLRAHAPHGLRVDRDSGGPTESEGVWERDRDFRATATRVHTDGWVNFAFTPYGGGLVVREDTFTGARYARTVLVPEDTTSVTVRRAEQSSGPHARPHARVRTVTDAGAVADLVRMVDRLPGAMKGQFVLSCPAALTQVSYRVAFATPDGAYVATLPTTGCWPSLTLTHDGARAGPPLDPGRAFARTVDRYWR